MHKAAAQGVFLLQQYEPLLHGLEDHHRGLVPTPGAKTAGWLLGHLVITGDFGRRLCGLLPAHAPKEWRSLFSPGTHPTPEVAGYPPMRELVDSFRTIYQDLTTNAPAASVETLGLPNPYEPARAAFPTAGDFARYMLTGHLGYHLGQLSQWRVAATAHDPSLGS